MPGMTMSPSPSMEKGRLASGSVMARGNSSLMGASKDLACSQRTASSCMQQSQCTEVPGGGSTCRGNCTTTIANAGRQQLRQMT